MGSDMHIGMQSNGGGQALLLHMPLNFSVKMQWIMNIYSTSSASPAHSCMQTIGY